MVVLFCSCSSKMGVLPAEYFTVTPAVLEVVGSEVPVTIDGKFPAKFFNKKSILTITPSSSKSTTKLLKCSNSTGRLFLLSF